MEKLSEGWYDGEGVSSCIVDPSVVVLLQSSNFMIIVLEVWEGGLDEIWVVDDGIVDACFVDKKEFGIEEVFVELFTSCLMKNCNGIYYYHYYLLPWRWILP